jgi:hypothetical protein
MATLFLFWINFGRQDAVILPDGTKLRLLGVSKGTNAFQEGSFLAKTFAKQIPPGGLSFFGYNLQRPISHFPIMDPEAPLTAWVVHSDLKESPNPFRFYLEGLRTMTRNADGREFRNSPVRPYSTTSPDLVRFAVPLYAFPRNQRSFVLRIFAPGKDGAMEEEYADFALINPFRGTKPRWVANPIPNTTEVDELRIVLREVQSVPAQVKFQLSSTNWTLAECKIYDQELNSRSMSIWFPPEKVSSVARFDYGLEPDQIWKIEAKFVRAAGFGLPMVGPEDFPENERFNIQVRSGSSLKLTNSVGGEYLCRFNGKDFSIQNRDGFDWPYVVILGATNENDQRVSFGGYGLSRSMLDPPIQSWSIKRPATQLNLHLAIPKIVSATFYVRPNPADSQKPEGSGEGGPR